MIYPFLLKREKENTRSFRKNIYFLVEGKNTEHYYFEGLINDSPFESEDNLRIYSFTKLGKDEGATQPIKMLKRAKDFASDSYNKFNEKIDKIVIIFDLDIYLNSQKEINKILSYKEDYMILGYTNPAFELFLLCHLEDSYRKIISPNSRAIIKNEFINSRRFVNYLLYEKTRINSKKSAKVAYFSKKYEIALVEESNLNSELNKAANKLTSNIGSIINYLKKKDEDNL